jgi:diaminohydroxyphosphoribosylaminopyrimidine deaminase/5-amino-6-(5-phosphoribosylamino)uracil reductase
LQPPPDDPSAADDSVWPLCLAIVAQRRRGRWPVRAQRFAPRDDGLAATADASAPLAWSPTQGWSLRGAPCAAAQAFFALYKPLLDRPPGAAPWVIGQLGQSLDGFVATHDGDSYYVTGPQNLAHLHRLRALCDAVLVGAGTVAADDPQLTTRRVSGEHPVRVVIDPALRVARGARVLRDAQAPTLQVHDAAQAAPQADPGVAAERLAVAGLTGADGALDTGALVAALHARGLALLFVEGGGTTVSRFIAQGHLDRLHLAIAPVLIGHGRRGLQLPGAARMADCLRPAARLVRLGDDMLWDLDLRRAATPVTVPR